MTRTPVEERWCSRCYVLSLIASTTFVHKHTNQEPGPLLSSSHSDLLPQCWFLYGFCFPSTITLPSELMTSPRGGPTPQWRTDQRAKWRGTVPVEFPPLQYLPGTLTLAFLTRSLVSSGTYINTSDQRTLPRVGPQGQWRSPLSVFVKSWMNLWVFPL